MLLLLLLFINRNFCVPFSSLIVVVVVVVWGEQDTAANKAVEAPLVGAVEAHIEVDPEAADTTVVKPDAEPRPRLGLIGSFS